MPTVTDTPPRTTDPAPTSVTASPPATSSPPTVVLPDLQGMDGATARDHLETLGIYAVGFEAVNGKSVLIKSMWQVVDQVPAPGAAINPRDGVTLRVDRFKETTQPEQPRPTEQPSEDEQDKQETRSEEPAPQRSEQPGSGTDPTYRTCAEANAHGHGPYVRGVDEEYGWYQDRDGDGVVCERR
ncbi:excalibur calcium-binding domain-containing protein [Nonomuraea sp. NPDC049400]|uniref:excalibur calcium-binding domain-containing protein n=1 Tax=Nonomuraea sp. NPDC049400 TaxID=3364352 RepID=UPI00378AC012